MFDREAQLEKQKRLFPQEKRLEVEKIDIRLLKYLYMIKDVPALYIGSKSLTALSYEIGGIATGIWLCEDVQNEAFHIKFNKYVAMKLLGDTHTPMDWSRLILKFTNSEEEAFDEFYKMLDDFLAQEGIVIEW